MNPKSFGKYLSELRAERNLTQLQLGRLIGVSNRVISKWETGISVPDADAILSLSEFYGISADSLLKEKKCDPQLLHTADTPSPPPAPKDRAKGSEKRGKATLSRSLIPPPSDDITGDYFCSWWMQESAAEKYGLHGKWATNARDALTSHFLFGSDTEFHPLPKEERRGLIYVIDDGWDVPFGTFAFPGKTAMFGSLEANAERFSDLGRTPERRLYRICENIRTLGYAATGLWIATERYGEDPEETYRFYAEHAILHASAGVRYRKVSRGTRERDSAYREIISRAVRENAPEIMVGHSVPQPPLSAGQSDAERQELAREISAELMFSDEFRIYHLIPPFENVVALRQLDQIFTLANLQKEKNPGALISAGARPYIAVALGCTLGMMGASPEGGIALRFHRLSPPFPIGEATYLHSEDRLTDRLYLENPSVSWIPIRTPALYEESAPARMSRGCPLPVVRAAGEPPFVIASRHPKTGVYAVGTFTRSVDPNPHFIALADVELPVEVEGDGVTVGVFGFYASLTLVFPSAISANVRVLIQDFLMDEYEDMTSKVSVSENKIRCSGTDLRIYGRRSQALYNEREPACLLRILFEKH